MYTNLSILNPSRLVPESECKQQIIRSDAPNIADGGQDVLNLRLVGNEKTVCCPLIDIIDTCDEDNGFKYE